MKKTNCDKSVFATNRAGAIGNGAKSTEPKALKKSGSDLRLSEKRKTTK